jgi:CubicO group peptidase (beta-lactamase class C family)
VTFTTDGLDAALAAHVESGSMPGLVALVARGDRVHVTTIGTLAFDDPRPMATDTIVRIASLSKPIAAVAAMMLVDDGRISLSEPVDRLLPELADRRVLRQPDSDLDDTVPAARPITVEDLLTFRLGFGLVMAPPGSLPIQKAEEELQLSTIGPPWPPPPFGPDEWMRRFGSLPLLAQPGEQWLYNTGAQVLGVLIERAAGRPLEEFLTARLFEPLGMSDTSFSVLAGAEHRVATAYAPGDDGPVVFDRPGGLWAQPPLFPNAAAWLLSTLDDYWAFVQMLRRGGVVDGRRLVSEAAMAAMTTDHLTPEQRRDAAFLLGGSGWGLGLAVPAADGTPARFPGYGWDGGSGTVWRTDPASGLVGILFTQLQLASPEPPAVFSDFWTAARQW